MVRLFDIQGGQPIASEHSHTLMFLRNIRKNFEEEHPYIYAYLFYMTCPNPDINPFFDVPEKDKEEMIFDQIGVRFSLENEDILFALEMCRKLYETPTYRAYRGTKIFLDRASDSLATEEITYGRDGNASALTRIAERMSALRQSYKDVFRELKEEQSSQTRGGRQLGYDQM